LDAAKHERRAGERDDLVEEGDAHVVLPIWGTSRPSPSAPRM
jgi:hypothetical protein